MLAAEARFDRRRKSTTTGPLHQLDARQAERSMAGQFPRASDGRHLLDLAAPSTAWGLNERPGAARACCHLLQSQKRSGIVKITLYCLNFGYPMAGVGACIASHAHRGVYFGAAVHDSHLGPKYRQRAYRAGALYLNLGISVASQPTRAAVKEGHAARFDGLT